jgi:hypothetical protein
VDPNVRSPGLGSHSFENSTDARVDFLALISLALTLTHLLTICYERNGEREREARRENK